MFVYTCIHFGTQGYIAVRKKFRIRSVLLINSRRHILIFSHKQNCITKAEKRKQIIVFFCYCLLLPSGVFCWRIIPRTSQSCG